MFQLEIIILLTVTPFIFHPLNAFSDCYKPFNIPLPKKENVSPYLYSILL